jgi:uncharacterized membrane protein
LGHDVADPRSLQRIQPKFWMHGRVAAKHGRAPMSPALLDDVAPLVQVHAFLALAAVALGLIQFFAPKGTISHRAFGWTWVAVMMGAFITVFASHDLVTWNPFSTEICCGTSVVCGGDRVTCGSIHTLAVLVFLSLPYAPLLARVSVINHRRIMVLLFLVMVVGGVSLMMPHRMLHNVVFGVSRPQAQTAR